MKSEKGTIQFICRIENLNAEGNTFVVADPNVYVLYPALFELPKARGRLFVMRGGEAHKTMETVLEICKNMLASGCDRKTTLIAVGGGVTGDTAGFAAAIYMRGLRWINVATTLLAQVDSAIGGKTGVDLDHYKNIVGAFHLPEKTVICTQFLKTLPPREHLCGLGEVIKTAFLDGELFEFVYAHRHELKKNNAAVTQSIVEKCARFKRDITQRDFLEGNLRKILNAGHTMGHAIESADGLRLSHGEYVLAGLLAEKEFFMPLVEPDFAKKAEELICSVLEKSSGALRFDAHKVVQAAMADKKNADGKISFMVAVKAGTVVEQWLTKEQLLEKVNAFNLNYGTGGQA